MMDSASVEALNVDDEDGGGTVVTCRECLILPTKRRDDRLALVAFGPVNRNKIEDSL
jgi:hypothetical protein